MNKRRSEHLNEYAAFTGNIFLFRKKNKKIQSISCIIIKIIFIQIPYLIRCI